jgi:hypothetical protein
MPSPNPSAPASSRRRLFIATAVIVGLLGAGAVVLDWLADPGQDTAGPVPPSPANPPVAAALPDRSASPVTPPASKSPQVLSLPGEFPGEGSGQFRFAGKAGEVLGTGGPLRRFRIAVEEGIDEDPDEVAEFVDATLGHRQSWTAGGALRLQQVPDGAGHDFTVYLATSATTARLCATVGLDVVGGSLPEGGVSCRTPGQVVLNLSRWRLSVPHYVASGVPLEVYRQMLVNHEVGHQLGYDHEACPGAGEPAPVMQQQTLRFDGCEANPWPYLDGERYTGPPVA